MTETHALPPDIKIHRLRFVAFGVAFLLVATIIGGAVIGFKTINRLNAIQSDWLEGLDSNTKLPMEGVTEDERLIKMSVIFVPILGLTVIVLLLSNSGFIVKPPNPLSPPGTRLSPKSPDPGMGGIISRRSSGPIGNGKDKIHGRERTARQ